MNEYTTNIQKLFLSVLLADSESYLRVENIFRPEYFDRQLMQPATFIKEYADQYKAMPKVMQVNAATASDLEVVPVEASTKTWFLDEFEKFIKHKAIERAILMSADLLEKGEFGPIEKLIKDAVSIGLTRTLGLEYLDKPKERLTAFAKHNNLLPTGWRDLDYKLFGGFALGSLNIFAGGSGSGKSIVLQNEAVNHMKQGKNVVFFTLELSADYCAKRIDSMTTGISTQEVLKRINDVELALIQFGKKSGRLRIIELPAQSTVADMKVCLKELQILTGRSVDVIIVDYLDLLMPSTVTVSVSDQFIKDKYVSEELRNLARDNNVPLVTASQLNRQAVDAPALDHSHIAGGISKINTADNVIGLFTSDAQRSRGEFSMQFLKTRNSNGVGSKVTLAINVDTLRLGDFDGMTCEALSDGQTRAQAILGSAQGAHKPRTGAHKPELKLSDDSKVSAVRELLANMKNGGAAPKNTATGV